MVGIIITGAAGFIGSHLSENISNRFYSKIIGIDNLSNGKLSNIKDLFGRKGFTFLRDDVKNVNTRDLPKRLEVIYHLAVSHAPTYTSYIKNIKITEKLLEIARKKDVEKFVFMSSTKAMGIVPSKKPLDELTLCKSSDWYGKSKFECEKIVKNFCERYSIKYYIFRAPRVFGPRDWQKTFVDFSTLISKTNIIPISPIKINLVYVKNLVEALYLILKKNVKSGVYIVSDEAYSISQISLTIAKIIGKKKAQKIKVPRIVFSFYSLLTSSFTHARKGIIYSSKKFRKEFNFRAPYTFYRGMKETLSYFNITKN
jgi:UDP-glucose 4-epimerase